jgi:hypothetical protein
VKSKVCIRVWYFLIYIYNAVFSHPNGGSSQEGGEKSQEDYYTSKDSNTAKDDYSSQDPAEDYSEEDYEDC